MSYRPNTIFMTPMYLLSPVTETVKGVPVKRYPDVSGGTLIYGSFKTFGGTESVSNDVLTVVDTAVIETWYRPDLEADSRLVINGKTYEVLGTPENIEMRNQFMRFKVRAVGGGA